MMTAVFERKAVAVLTLSGMTSCAKKPLAHAAMLSGTRFSGTMPVDSGMCH